jgi:hypothetical protein
MSYVPSRAQSRPGLKRQARKSQGLVGINVGLPRKLHRKLRLVCLQEDKTLDDAAAEAFAMWIGKAIDRS